MNPQQPQQPTGQQPPQQPQQQPTTYIAPAPEYYVPPEFQRIPKGQAKKPGNKKLVVVIVLVIALAILGAGGYFLYSLIGHPGSNETTQNAPELKEVPAPASIIENYTKETIPSRNTLYTQREEAPPAQPAEPIEGSPAQFGPTNGVIIYQPSDKYGTAISVGDRVQYVRKDSVKTNDASLQSATKAFLAKSGLVEQAEANLGGEVMLTTYDSKNVICQVSDNSSLGSSPAAFGIACVDKSVLTAQYDSIDALLPLATGLDMASVTDVTKATTSQNSMQLVTLTVTVAGEANSYYFATLGKDWEYLGKRPISTPDDPNGFTMPNELKEAISDPKWGTFLKNNIH